MKNAIVLSMILCLTVSLFAVSPASAEPNPFWTGVAIGAGSAIILGHIFHNPRAYHHDYRPVRVYTSPGYDRPFHPQRDDRERWGHGHWDRRY